MRENGLVNQFTVGAWHRERECGSVCEEGFGKGVRSRVGGEVTPEDNNEGGETI